jgi:hypothetical protein
MGISEPPAPRPGAAAPGPSTRDREKIAKSVRAADMARGRRRETMRRRVMAEAARLHCADQIPDDWELPI